MEAISIIDKKHDKNVSFEKGTSLAKPRDSSIENKRKTIEMSP